MRLIFKDVDREGVAEVKVNIADNEDLWQLFNLINVGDTVKTKTVRKVIKENATGRDSSERRVLVLAIAVTRIDFDAAGVLRLSGRNQTESEHVKMNAFHTLEITADPPQDVTLIKGGWDSVLDQRIREACDNDVKADTAAIIMHEGLANVCLVTPSMVITKARIEHPIPKKRKFNAGQRDKALVKFYQLTMDAMIRHINFDKVKVVLVCSPGFVRDDFVNHFFTEAVKNDKTKELLTYRPKFCLCHVSCGHKYALKEAFADKAVLSKLENTKAVEDMNVWQKFHDMMNDDPDRCAYGPDHVQGAMSKHAIDNLLICDSLFRAADPAVRRRFVTLVDDVQSYGGTVHVFSTQHVTGEQLKMLTGVAAILRFPCPELDELEEDLGYEVEEHGMVRTFTAEL